MQTIPMVPGGILSICRKRAKFDEGEWYHAPVGCPTYNTRAGWRCGDGTSAIVFAQGHIPGYIWLCDNCAREAGLKW